MVGPDLSIVDVVVLVGEVVADHVVHLLLHEGTDVVEHGLFLLAHRFTIYYIFRWGTYVGLCC